MAVSPRLNPREQNRARQAVERLTALQQTIAERDDKRREWGKDIDKLYLDSLGLLEKGKGPKGQKPGGGNGAGGPGAGASGQQASDASDAESNQGLTAGSPLSFARGVASNLATATGLGR